MKKLIIATAILCVSLGLASLQNARTLSPASGRPNYVLTAQQINGGGEDECFWSLEGGSDQSFPRTIYTSLSPPSFEPLPWQLVAEGQLAAIYAEHTNTLYQKEGSDRFFVHIRVQNKTRNEIGVDLGDYNKVVYPNQWEVYQELPPRRGHINEERIIPIKLDETLRRSLLTSYLNHTLAMIKPKAAVDYYREFNARTIKQVETNNGKYLLISLDGQIFDTDGKSVETITLEWGKGRDFWTSLWFTFPVRWKNIPKGGLVVGENQLTSKPNTERK